MHLVGGGERITFLEARATLRSRGGSEASHTERSAVRSSGLAPGGKVLAPGIETSVEKDEEECAAVWSYPPESHLPPNYFAARLDRLVVRGRRCARRVGVHSTQIVALRVVSGPSGGTLRDVPPNVHTRAARDQDRRRLLSLPRLRRRSKRVDRRPRADVRESRTAEATGADGVDHQLGGPPDGFGALRNSA